MAGEGKPADIKIVAYYIYADKRINGYVTNNCVTGGTMFNDTQKGIDQMIDRAVTETMPVSQGWSNHQVRQWEIKKYVRFDDGRIFKINVEEISEDTLSKELQALSEEKEA